MPASVKRKALRAEQFGRPPPAPKAPKRDKRKRTRGRTSALGSSAAAAPAEASLELPPMLLGSDEEEEIGGGGVALPSDDESLGGSSASGEENGEKATETTGLQTKQPKAPRYILFVGNLPFEATTAGVEAHFAAVRPTQVRHRTDKATGRSRGFAFVEFDSHARMDACLTRYHRSEYVEGREAAAIAESKAAREAAEAPTHSLPLGADSRKKEGPQGARRINVQLTAGGGGGGKSETRRKRLREKNEKLDRERNKRLKKGRSKKVDRKAKKASSSAAAADGATNHAFEAEEGMHPSRKARFARG